MRTKKFYKIDDETFIKAVNESGSISQICDKLKINYGFHINDVKHRMKQLNLNEITAETNGEWKDGHLGTAANKILAEEIYNYILNNK